MRINKKFIVFSFVFPDSILNVSTPDEGGYGKNIKSVLQRGRYTFVGEKNLCAHLTESISHLVLLRTAELLIPLVNR